MTRKQQFERLINEKFKSNVPIVHCDQLFTPGCYPAVVQARSVLCFLAVRELCITTTELAGQMGLSQPAISMSVKRGAGIVKAEKLSIDDLITKLIY